MPKWTQEEDKRLRETYHQLTGDELEKAFNRTRGAISWRAREIGLLKKIGYRALNRFPKLNESEAAWLAGFIDGDGCFTYRNDKRNDGIVPALIIANTHENTMRWICQRLNIKSMCETKDKWRARFSINITALRTLNCLVLQILPYLKVKKKQAGLMLKFIKIKMTTRKHSDLLIIRDKTYRLNGLTGSNGQVNKHQNLF